MHCRKCRYSEGAAIVRGGRWRLVLWCQVHCRRAKRVCSSFAQLEGEA